MLNYTGIEFYDEALIELDVSSRGIICHYFMLSGDEDLLLLFRQNIFSFLKWKKARWWAFFNYKFSFILQLPHFSQNINIALK